jgi:hypothetical protein
MAFSSTRTQLALVMLLPRVSKACPQERVARARNAGQLVLPPGEIGASGMARFGGLPSARKGTMDPMIEHLGEGVKLPELLGYCQ